MSLEGTGATHFPADPILVPIGTSGRFKLVQDYVYFGFTRVPAGFEHDMASVPRAVWAIISPFELGPAALVHDWLYHVRDRPRSKADKLFLAMMQAYGIPWWRRYAAYAAVRAAGGSRWNRK